MHAAAAIYERIGFRRPEFARGAAALFTPEPIEPPIPALAHRLNLRGAKR
jgi:hypothetical protein